MTKTFSTKLDSRVLASLDAFCHKHHLKKSSFLEEIIAEGIQKKAEALELVRAIERGLDEEERGELYTLEEAQERIFGRKKSGKD